MSLIQQIDALLPQTQCGKCGHPGCKPYAQGIAQGEAINKCPPGADETIGALATLLKIPVIALDTDRGTAPAQIAFIREAECIGCTKCIQACPVDAILGAAKLMHTVIVDECTGCDLCVAPCPVDCIEMRPLPGDVIPVVSGLAHGAAQRHARTRKRDHARLRYEQRKARLSLEEQLKQAQRLARTQQTRIPAVAAHNPTTPSAPLADAALKKAKVTLAMARAQLHKSLKAFGHPPTAPQQSQLIQLQAQFERAEQALAQLEQRPELSSNAPLAPGADVKRAKIQLALRRAELKKAINQALPSEQLTSLNEAVTHAELTLAALDTVKA